VKTPSELLRRLQLLEIRAMLCGNPETALRINLMITTVEFLLDIDNESTRILSEMVHISPEEFEILKDAERIYSFYRSGGS
jgi:hypothetical protein